MGPGVWLVAKPWGQVSGWLRDTGARRSVARFGFEGPVLLMRKLCLILFCIVIIALAGCGKPGLTPPAQPAGQTPSTEQTQAPTQSPSGRFKYSYGVFIGADPENTTGFKDYQTIVIDAAYFSQEELADLHKQGHTVYSYLNIGSLEDFRDYYATYRHFSLGAYENWPGEYWIDVSQPQWQTFTVETLAKSLVQKGVDGFFIDNVDVYYNFQKQRIYDGVKAILAGLSRYGLPLVINGGDTWVSEALENGDSRLISGVNQECVLTSIDFDKGSFGKQTADDTEYFTKYLEQCKKKGLTVYLLEYTTDKDLQTAVREFCEKNGYQYYVASTLDLT